MIIKAAAVKMVNTDCFQSGLFINDSTTQMAKPAEFAPNLKTRINTPAKSEYMIIAINIHPKLDSSHLVKDYLITLSHMRKQLSSHQNITATIYTRRRISAVLFG